MNCPHCNSENIHTYIDDPDQWICMKCGWIFPKAKGVEGDKQERVPEEEYPDELEPYKEWEEDREEAGDEEDFMMFDDEGEF